jgi:hypothetical protein
MNAKFGGLQTSPKLRLLPCSVVAVMRRLLRVLLVEVGEVVHEVVEAISECTNVLIHSMKSVVDLPHALVELQKIIIGDVVVPLLLLWLLIGPSAQGISLLLQLLLLVALPKQHCAALAHAPAPAHAAALPPHLPRSLARALP